MESRGRKCGGKDVGGDVSVSEINILAIVVTAAILWFGYRLDKIERR